jgi:rod shape-determining protein MreB
VIISVPAAATQLEKRAVEEVTIKSGAGKVYLIEKPMAAAIWIGLDIFEPKGHMIVDIGYGITEIVVLSLGGIVEKMSFKVAGDKFTHTIIDFIRYKYIVQIGERTAEEMKIKIGTALQLDEEESMVIKGRDLITGLPKLLTITSEEVREVLGDIIQQILKEIKVILDRTHPELASDIKKEGIFLVGGGALLRGIDKKISESLDLKVTIPDDPSNTVINGINVMLRDFSRYSRLLISSETD